MEDVRIAVNAALADRLVLSFWQALILALFCGIGAYIGAYLKKRGENKAMREDIRALTDAVKQIETAYAREIEGHKIELLKSKTIYEERLKAYSKFIGLVYEIRPDMSHPDAGFDDFMENLGASLDTTRGKLKGYIVEYAGVLPLGVRDLVMKCHSACEIGQFGNPSDQGAAQTLWKTLWEANAAFRKHLNLEEEIKQ